MAEEKKKILIHTADGDHVVSVGEHKPKQTFGAMPVKDYVAAVADPDGLPQAGSVGAVVSALAAAMGSLAVRALRSDDAQMQKTAEELRQMTDYMVFQIDEELRGARGDIQVRRMGYYDGGRLLGYAAYRFESASACNYTQTRLSVAELVYENGTVLRALLGGLRMQEDLAQAVILRTGEEDFHHLLDDPQDVSGNYIDYGFLQTNVSAVGTMFKLTDGADFVRRTGYRNFPAGTLTAAFRYRDEMADREEELRIGFADGRWAVAEGTADVTVICRQGDLAALLMGSCGLTALLRLGAASADDAEKARQLAQLLYCVQKPWLNADY